MNAILTGFGKFLLFVPLIGFGVKHLYNAQELAGMVPAFFPGGIFWIYLTGTAMLLAVVSNLVGKFDKLAFFLAGLMILVFALTIHFRGMMDGGSPMVMFNLLKDLGLAGACWLFAARFSRDSSIIG